MSSLIVEVVKIDDILEHPNADRLSIARIKGWNCVVRKGDFKKGDKAIYFPIDSVLPDNIVALLFPPSSKIKLKNSRVKTIKIRGAISQGLLSTLDDLHRDSGANHVGDDLTELLGVKKYEPPVEVTLRPGSRVVSPKQTNPFFNKYTDIENYKNYTHLFEITDDVYVLEKIHGTNFRAGCVPFYPYTIWQHILKFFKLAPKYVFVFGSHNVQLQNKIRCIRYKGYYKENVYLEAVRKYDLIKKLKPNEVIYGEIYGYGVQKGYTYDCGVGERKLAVFDVKLRGLYINHSEVIDFCKKRGLPTVPVIHKGVWPNQEDLKVMSTGASILDPLQKIREGIVIKPFTETICYIGRKILKYKNDYFLLTQEDDTH